MLKATPKNLLILLIAFLVAISLHYYLTWAISPLRHQLPNLKLANVQAQVLEGKFKTDARFKQISFTQYTPFDGCLLVFGTIRTAEDVRYITNAVESIPCPVGICYQLSDTNGLLSFGWYDHGKDAPNWLNAKTN